MAEPQQRNYEELLKLMPQIQYEFRDPNSPTVAAVRDQFAKQSSGLPQDRVEEMAKAMLFKQFNDSKLGGKPLTEADFNALNQLEHSNRMKSLTDADLAGLVQAGKIPQGTTLDQARQQVPASDYFGPQRSFYLQDLAPKPPATASAVSMEPLAITAKPAPAAKATKPKAPRKALPPGSTPHETAARGVLDMLMNLGEQQLPYQQ